jgi:branched-chain amino acid transport system substrate-binding protein
MTLRLATIWRILAVLLVGFLLPVAAMSAEGSLRVGVLGQRTGSNMAIGLAYEEGISLALETINEEQGGVLGKRLEVTFEDSGGTPERAAAALNKLISVDGVVMTVGETLSQCALVESEMADRYHHPLLVAEALADEVTARNSRYVFRAGPCNTGIIQDTLMGFISESGFQRIAMIVEDTEFGRDAAPLVEGELKALGLQTLILSVARGNRDPVAVLNALKDFKPDMTLVLHYAWDMPAFEAQIQAAGFPAPLPLLFSGPSLTGLWSNSGPIGQSGAYLTLRAVRLHPSVDLTGVSHKLRQDYQRKFGKDLSDYRVRAIYDVLLIAADALRRAGSGDCERVVAALEQTRLPVASGVVQFGQELGSYHYHHWQPPLLIVQWQQQQPVVVYPPKTATGNLLR